MNFKKTILTLLTGIFLLVLVYNFVLPNMVSQSYGQMGMHMNNQNYNSVYYLGSMINLLIFVFIIIAAVVTILKIFSLSNQKKCRKCGLTIESEEWKICPRCGHPLHDGSVNC